MRIVALHAIHFVFENGVVMRQLKLSVRLEVTLKTRGGIFSRIDDESTPGRGDVFARRAMTRLATRSARQFFLIEMNSRMNAAWKFLGNRRMAIGASFVANVSRAGNFQRNHNGRIRCGTGTQQENRRGKYNEQNKQEDVTENVVPEQNSNLEKRPNFARA